MNLVKLHDYPRKEKKRYDKSGEIATVFEGKYELSDELMELIADDIGDNVFLEKEFTYLKKFDNSDSFSGIKIDKNEFFKSQTLRRHTQPQQSCGA